MITGSTTKPDEINNFCLESMNSLVLLATECT